MKCIVQRVLRAEVRVGGERRAGIARGLVALVGIEQGDTQADGGFIAEKIVHLRVFEDDAGKMNLSVLDVGGDVLMVPNFTVAGSTAKGRRPSFDGAMPPERAAPAFDGLVRAVRAFGPAAPTGVFGADMHVDLVNDGPVTLILSSRRDGTPG